MTKKTVVGLFLAAAMFSAGALAQIAAPPGVSQEHLDKAKAIAFGSPDTAYFPGLLACYGSGDYENNTANPPPTKVFDNLYFVGLGTVGPFALTTSAGIILFDALDDEKEAREILVPGLKAIGLNPADIKFVVITHGHGDHYGGANYLKATYGARLLASKEDWAFMATQKNPSGNGSPAKWADLVPDHDMDIADGEKLTLGGETITFYVTPGHTPGSVSTIIPVTDKGVPHIMAFWGGFAVHGGDAQTHATYDNSITRWEQIVKDTKADGFLSNHPAQGDIGRKLVRARADKNGSAFVVGAAETMRYLEVLRECNLYNADVSAASRRNGAVGRRGQ